MSPFLANKIILRQHFFHDSIVCLKPTTAQCELCDIRCVGSITYLKPLKSYRKLGYRFRNSLLLLLLT